MALVGAALLAATAVSTSLYWAHHLTRARERATLAAEDATLMLLKSMSELRAVLVRVAERPDPPPLDLAPLAFTQELAAALNARMDTINSDMAILTTRVETGPGKRTIAFP